jgi:hypothetical protein
MVQPTQQSPPTRPPTTPAPRPDRRTQKHMRRPRPQKNVRPLTQMYRLTNRSYSWAAKTEFKRLLRPARDRPSAQPDPPIAPMSVPGKASDPHITPRHIPARWPAHPRRISAPSWRLNFTGISTQLLRCVSARSPRAGTLPMWGAPIIGAGRWDSTRARSGHGRRMADGSKHRRLTPHQIATGRR